MKRAILALLLTAIMIPAALADPNSAEFNYNGLVRVQGVPYNGNGYFKFSIVNGDGSTTYWANDGTTLDGTEPASNVLLGVSDGFFSVNIGDSETTGMTKLNPAVFDRQARVYLRVWFSDGTHGFEKLQPDRAIANPALLGDQASQDVLDLYVDASTGNDANNGLSSSKAKKTIQAAVNLLPARIDNNVTVHIASGVYREQVKLIGISVDPDHSLTILGDPTTVPTDSVDPNVRISGSDNDVTPVRARGILIYDSTGLIVKGIVVDHCSTYGIASSFSGCVFINCKSRNNTYDGFLAAQGELQYSACYSKQNGRYGFSFSQFAHVIMNTCTAKSNSSDGVNASRSMLWLNASCLFTTNSGNGVHASDLANVITYASSAASVTSNSQYGLRLSYDSHVRNNSNISYAGNTSGSTYTEYGSAIY